MSTITYQPRYYPSGFGLEYEIAAEEEEGMYPVFETAASAQYAGLEWCDDRELNLDGLYIVQITENVVTEEVVSMPHHSVDAD